MQTAFMSGRARPGSLHEILARAEQRSGLLQPALAAAPPQSRQEPDDKQGVRRHPRHPRGQGEEGYGHKYPYRERE